MNIKEKIKQLIREVEVSDLPSAYEAEVEAAHGKVVADLLASSRYKKKEWFLAKLKLFVSDVERGGEQEDDTNEQKLQEWRECFEKEQDRVEGEKAIEEMDEVECYIEATTIFMKIMEGMLEEEKEKKDLILPKLPLVVQEMKEATKANNGTTLPRVHQALRDIRQLEEKMEKIKSEKTS